jgi:hypothetical protein
MKEVILAQNLRGSARVNVGVRVGKGVGKSGIGEGLKVLLGGMGYSHGERGIHFVTIL